MFNNKISKVNSVYTIILLLFFVACVIMFWYFILNTTFLSALYPAVAVGIVAHLGVLYTSVWFYLAKKQRTLVEQFKIWFNKK